MNKTPDIMDRVYLYKNRGKSVVTLVGVTIDEVVKHDILREAVKESLKVFYLFSLQPFFTADNKVEFKENPNEVPVYRLDEGKHLLGSADTNGYMFCVYYEEDRIKLSASHVVGDARADIDFLERIVFEYYRLKGAFSADNTGSEDVPSIRPEEEAFTGLYEAALSHIENIETKSDETKAADCEILFPTYIEKTDRPYDSGRLYMKRSISFSYDSLLKIAKRYDVSPSLIISDAISRAMERVYDTEGKNFKICVSVDMRNKYGVDSMHNFATGIYLIYPSDGGKPEPEKRYEILKEEFKRALDFNKLSKGIKEDAELMKMLEAYLNLNDYKSVEAVVNKGLMDKLPSFYIASMGRFNFKESIRDHIKTVDFNGVPTTGETCYYSFVYEGRYTLNIAGCHENKETSEALVNILNEMGLDACEDASGLEDTDFLDVNGFIRLSF